MNYPRARVWRGSTAKGVMNKTEERFASRLALMKAAGEILGYRYEAVKFCIVSTCPNKRIAVYYTPDFMIQRADCELEMVDVKGSGGWSEDAKLKMKMAAAQFPEFHWVGYTWTKAKTWEREEFN